MRVVDPAETHTFTNSMNSCNSILMVVETKNRIQLLKRLITKLNLDALTNHATFTGLNV